MRPPNPPAQTIAEVLAHVEANLRPGVTMSPTERIAFWWGASAVICIAGVPTPTLSRLWDEILEHANRMKACQT